MSTNSEQDLLIDGSSEHECLLNLGHNLLINDSSDHECLPNYEQNVLINNISNMNMCQIQGKKFLLISVQS